jgi:hypothetical protein
MRTEYHRTVAPTSAEKDAYEKDPMYYPGVTGFYFGSNMTSNTPAVIRNYKDCYDKNLKPKLD